MFLHCCYAFGRDRRMEKTELTEDREIGDARLRDAEKERTVTQ